MGHSLLIIGLYNELIKTKQADPQHTNIDVQIIFFIKQSPVVTLPLYRASPLPKIRKHIYVFPFLLFRSLHILQFFKYLPDTCVI